MPKRSAPSSPNRHPQMLCAVVTDIEALVIALGGEVKEGDGSRVALRIGEAVKHAHRPHPGKEAKRYQVEEIRDWLKAQGIEP